MAEAKILKFHRPEELVLGPPLPKIDYHCSFVCDDPQSIVKLAQLAADLGVKMFILDHPRV